jgi:hypothetical protein
VTALSSVSNRVVDFLSNRNGTMDRTSSVASSTVPACVGSESGEAERWREVNAYDRLGKVSTYYVKKRLKAYSIATRLYASVNEEFSRMATSD